MRSDPIAKTWRKYLVNTLQERYGLAEEEARRSANACLRRLLKQPSLQQTTEGQPRAKMRTRAAFGKSAAI
jgi:hypothetical protein